MRPQSKYRQYYSIEQLQSQLQDYAVSEPHALFAHATRLISVFASLE